LVPVQEYVYGGCPPCTDADQVTKELSTGVESEGVQEEIIAEEATMVRVKVCEWLRGVPVTVMVYVPGLADGETVKRMVDEQVGPQGSLDIEYDTPAGMPDRDRSTDSVVPEVRVRVTVVWPYWSIPPLVTDTLAGLERVYSKGGGGVGYGY
jgi:hypothetical protein